MCVIDAVNIYCWPSSVDPATGDAQTQWQGRGTGSCKIALDEMDRAKTFAMLKPHLAEGA